MTRMPAAVEMDVAEGAEAEGARRATAAFGPSVTSRATDPDPEVPAKAQRRRFPAEYRLRILTQADACKKPGELGALFASRGVVLVLAHQLASAARAGRLAGHARTPARTQAAAG